MRFWAVRTWFEEEWSLLGYYKAILKPIWTYGIELWSMATTSNTEIVERFQSKVLRVIVDTTWYVLNTVIWRDLQTPILKEEIRQYSSQYCACLSVHPNDPVVNLMAQPDNRQLQYTCQTICLPDSKCNCLICSTVFKVWFVSFFPTNYNRLCTNQLQKSATEPSPTCHCINFYTIFWMYLYRLHINGITKNKFSVA
jgi:hypothetical protein